MAPVSTAFSQWRSPPPAPTPSLEPVDLPQASSPAPTKADLLHPSFLPPCEHAKDGGEMHAHAFDLLSLAAAKASSAEAAASSQSKKVEPGSSVPATSYLSATRPPNGTTSSASGTKARRMSSSTTGVLGRGKLGLTGDSGLLKDTRPTLSSSQSGSAIPGRRLSNAAVTGSPQLFDFAKTDRRPGVGGRTSSARSNGIAASLPSQGIAGGAPIHVNPPPAVAPQDDMELDMEFDGDDEDRSGNRSGSAEFDMEIEDENEYKGEWEKLALGTGSGGIKGRRKGMVFKCESCAKEYRHPSCLIKHRWEHSPHWREPTQISMSKHQQVQMLEAAAILAHMDPSNAHGRSLPNDKSLWPAILSPSSGPSPLLRSAKSSSRELPRSPSVNPPPLTPSSLRESSVLKDRKSSPGSDSTNSMDGADSLGTSPNPNSLGLKGNGLSRPMGINAAGRRSSVSSGPGGPATPHSLGSLGADMNGLHFHSGTPTGTSPIPNRGLPLSLTARATMIGGGMFGQRGASFKLPDSSVRGGAEDEEDELRFNNRGKSSSEEADERRRDNEEPAFGIDNMDL